MSNEKTPATNQELGRKLGLGAVIALGVGTTVGSGIFSSLSEVANAAGSFSVHPADRCRDLAAQLLVQLPTVLDILTHEEQPSATSSANNTALEGEAL